MEIRITKKFKKQAKSLLKKYHSLKNEIFELQENLKNNPTMGALIKENIYKIRVAVKSKGKGKSGGLRVITFLEYYLMIDTLQENIENNKEENPKTIINLLTIYDKSEISSISEDELNTLIENISFDENE